MNLGNRRKLIMHALLHPLDNALHKKRHYIKVPYVEPEGQSQNVCHITPASERDSLYRQTHLSACTLQCLV